MVLASRLFARRFVASSRRFASTLVIAEPENPTVTSQAVRAAEQLGNPVHVLAAPSALDVPASVQSVFTVPSALPECISQAIQALPERPTAVLAAGTKFGNSVLPRVAAVLDVAPVADVRHIEGDLLWRALYAGNVLAQIQLDLNQTQAWTIQPTQFEPLESLQPCATVVALDVPVPTTTVPVASSGESGDTKDEIDLTQATTVVSGGRGLQNGENFALLEALAQKLPQCAVGASRAAVDAGMRDNNYQVGQTGKVVAPQLYIAVGISGAIQHISGMKDSKTIVAINKDPEAPIFELADYGLVEDLFTAVPELTDKL